MTGSLKILCLSVDPWSELWKRKQRLMFELARLEEVAAVLYVDPPQHGHFFKAAAEILTNRLPTARRNAIIRAWFSRPFPVATRCWTYHSIANAIPASRVPIIKWLDDWIYRLLIRTASNRLPGDKKILWLYDPFDWQITRIFSKNTLVCFDWTDDWVEFTEPIGIKAKTDSLKIQSEYVLRNADLIFTVSEPLYKRAIEINPETVRLPNATDFRMLNSTGRANISIPEELGKLTHPIIGYLGQIREDRIDVELAQFIAESRPTWSYVYIGPIIGNGPGLEALSTINNIHFLGPKPFNLIADYLYSMDVCIIPHRRNNLVMSMDPIKLYDYLASGKPIVTVPVSGVEPVSDLIYIADDPTSFLEKIEQAICENNTDLVNRRLEFARENSWQNRAETALSHIKQALEKGGIN